MNARQFFKRPAAETEAPPTETPTEAPPTTRPDTRPSQPETPNPWRRRDVNPGEEPAPKAAYGMDATYTESASRVVSNLLEDDKGI